MIANCYGLPFYRLWIRWKVKIKLTKSEGKKIAWLEINYGDPLSCIALLLWTPMPIKLMASKETMTKPDTLPQGVSDYHCEAVTALTGFKAQTFTHVLTV